MYSVSCLPLHIEIGRSRRLAALLLLIHLVPVIPLFLALQPLTATALSLLSLFSLWQYWQRYVRFTPRTSVIGLRISGEKSWFLDQTDGTQRKATLRHAFVRRGLTILQFDAHHGRRRVVLLPDAVDENAYHRLRIFLNCMQ